MKMKKTVNIPGYLILGIIELQQKRVSGISTVSAEMEEICGS